MRNILKNRKHRCRWLTPYSQVRENLLGGTFADNLKLLQNYPSNDVQGILQRAVEIRKGEYTAPPPRPKAELRRFIGSPAISRPAGEFYYDATWNVLGIFMEVLWKILTKNREIVR